MSEDQDFGAFLRQARERRGITLRQIADRTKISVLALEALERNDISRLPGGIFSRSFVRAYAQEAGLEAEDTVRRFVARFPQASMEESPEPYEPNPERITVDEPPSFGGGWRALGWALPILLVIAYFGFGGRVPFLREKPAPAAPAVSEAPQVPPPPPARQAPETSAPSVPEEEPATGNLPVPAIQPAAGEKLPGGAEATTAAQAQGSGQAPAGANAPPAEGILRLTLAPREDCWVRVESGGEALFSGLMRGGERRDVEVKGDAMLTVGNAGVFDFAVNGLPGRSLGNPGQVSKVRIGPANFQDYVQGR